MNEKPEKEQVELTPEQAASLAEVFKLVFEHLEELSGARIAAMAGLGGLVAALSRKGVITAADLKYIEVITAEIAERMEKAQAEGLDLDAYLKHPPKGRKRGRKPKGEK